MIKYRKEIFELKRVKFVPANGSVFGTKYYAWTYWANEDNMPVRRVWHITRVITGEHGRKVDIFYPCKEGFISMGQERCFMADKLAELISQSKEDPEKGMFI